MQSECMYPKAVNDVSQVKMANMQWEEVEEIDDGARRRREDSNSLENVGVAGNVAQRCERSAAVSPDEIGKNYEKLKTTVITRSSDKAEQSRRPTSRHFRTDGWDRWMLKT